MSLNIPTAAAAAAPDAGGLSHDELVAQITAAVDASVWEPGVSDDTASDPSIEPDAPWTVRALTRESDAESRGMPLPGALGRGIGELPYDAFEEFAISSTSTAKVNVANGNLLVAANDVRLSGAAVGWNLDRFYNSLSRTDGSFGEQWTVGVGGDVGLMGDTAAGTGDITFVGPNGYEVVFHPVANATDQWSTDAFDASLRRVPNANPTLTRYELRFDQSGETLRFNTNGWLERWDDRNGVGISLSYASSSTGYKFETLQIDGGTSGEDAYLDYDTSDRIERVQLGSRFFTYEYESEQLRRVKDATGAQLYEYIYDDDSELLVEIVAAATRVDGHTQPGYSWPDRRIGFSYDRTGRVIEVRLEQPGAATLVTAYSYLANETVVTDPKGNTFRYHLNTDRLVERTTDQLSRERSQTWTSRKDVQTTTDAFADATNPGNLTTYSYDGLGNMTSVSMPTGAAAQALYAQGPSCPQSPTGTAFNMQCSVDAAGNTQAYSYDTVGNLQSVTDTTGGAAAVQSSFTYATGTSIGSGSCGGFAGQVCTATDANGKTTSYTYDGHGRVTTVAPPAPLGQTTYTYDEVNRLKTVTDGNGHTTTYQYDIHDRVVRITYHDGSTSSSLYLHDGAAFQQLDSPNGAVRTHEFNIRRQLTRQVTNIDENLTGGTDAYNVTYTYDGNGNITSENAGDGVTTHTYDAANQLSSTSGPGGSCGTGSASASGSKCVKFQYDANGAETLRTYPGNAHTATTRDASGRATRLATTTGDGATVVDIGYSYVTASGDGAQITSRTSYMEQGIPAGAITTYQYDSLGRLTAATEQAGSATNASWAYAYDPAGNRTSQTRTGNTGSSAGSITYTYNDANQITSSSADTTTWTYDNVGNQTKNGITGLTTAYNSRMQAATIGATAQSYFGPGNTTRLESGAVKELLTPLGLTQRSTAGSTTNFIRTADGEAVGFRTGTADNYYIHDHLGSIVGILTSNGAFAGGYSYSPYGEARFTATSSAVTSNPLRYISGQSESAGVYKLGARYYDTTLGRFTQMDPSGQETNPYLYAGGDPINALDPTGLEITLGDVAWNLLVSAACYYASGGLAGSLLCGLLFEFTDDIVMGLYDYAFATYVAACTELTAVVGSPINLCWG